jgi:hypothetical protein
LGFDLTTIATRSATRTSVGSSTPATSAIRPGAADHALSASRFNADFTPETRLPLTVDDYILNDISFTYDLGSLVGLDRLDSLDARLAIRNLGDVERRSNDGPRGLRRDRALLSVSADGSVLNRQLD